MTSSAPDPKREVELPEGPGGWRRWAIPAAALALFLGASLILETFRVLDAAGRHALHLGLFAQ